MIFDDHKCPEYCRLEAEVDECLRKLRDLTNLQLEVFRSRNYPSFARLDRELELTVGTKERSIGAFNQHSKEHKCQPNMNSAFVDDPK
jgi:hypothetical protein